MKNRDRAEDIFRALYTASVCLVMALMVFGWAPLAWSYFGALATVTVLSAFICVAAALVVMAWSE